MGAQVAGALVPGVARQQEDLEEERQALLTHLQRASLLLADPLQLENECEFHFQRAGLDANGHMRRIELRRLLWTFAHHLGSTDLTWEKIEAAAVVGTIDPQIPVVAKDQFFRCVLKTVHLVDAELRQKIAEVEERTRPPEPKVVARPAPAPRDSRASPWGALARQHGAASSSSSSAVSSDAEDSDDPASRPRGPGALPPGRPRPGAEAGGCATQGAPPAAAVSRAVPAAPQPVAFTPAPNSTPDDIAAMAPVNGMMAMVLNNEGAFDPQRIFVTGGSLMLSDPSEPGPSSVQRLMCFDGRSSFELALLEVAVCGEEIRPLPIAQILPNYVVRSQESLARMLVLAFQTGEALCLWFASPEDCEFCRDAIASEARSGSVRR